MINGEYEIDRRDGKELLARETFWIDTSDSFYKHAFYNK